ncbi:hypothetical protein Ancab_017419 [Ancistrocladus abbreviatus]
MSQDGRDTDDEEEYEEAGGGSRLLGFMFGNVDYSGELDVDYLDEDAKEHLDALADKLGSSLTDIDLSGKSPRSSATAVDEDYDEKAEDAVDYEDIDEQYDGPETQVVSEEDYLLPKRDFLTTDTLVTALEHKSSVFDDENYDEDEDYDKEHEVGASNSEVKTIGSPGLALDSQSKKESVVLGKDTPPVEQAEHNVVALTEEIALDTGSVDTQIAAAVDVADQEAEPAFLGETSYAKTSLSLPILCVEDGVTILRFSEIFGVNVPPKKRERRERRYSIPKDKYTSVDTEHNVEEDEETYLKGSWEGFSFSKPSLSGRDDASVFLDDNLESSECGFQQRIGTAAPLLDCGRRDSCVSAEPMRKDFAVNLCTEGQPSLFHKFYPLDQQDWEDRIIWGNSPAVSDHSVESCQLSGPDPESVVDEEKEVQSKPQSHQCDYRMTQDDETYHGSCTSTSLVSVEPFGSRDCAGLVNFSYLGGCCHPQLLRLETPMEQDTSDFSNIRKDNVPDELQQDFVRRFSRLTLQNRDLLEGSWLEEIIWDSEKPIVKPKLILDLQDEQMLFEISDRKDYRHLHLHAGAMFISQTRKSSAGDVVELPGHGAKSSIQFNIANDEFYSNRKTSPQMKTVVKKRSPSGVRVGHSVPALKLETMKPKLSNKDVANFHRPKALWYPHSNEKALRELEKLPTQGPMKIVVKSVGGKGSKIYVDPEETISSVKEKASKKFDFRVSEKVRILYSGKELEDHKTLAEHNVHPNSLLHLVQTKIHILQVSRKLPGENKSLSPAAFKKSSDLSVKDGHVFLMEYCEERPLLLGNVGMGARLCTYYQKSSTDDQTGDLLRNGDSCLGIVLTLDPADKSPFLGDIKPGFCQSSLETNMYRVPVFPHKVSSTDYLLVRSSKGKLSIRRIDRINVVGQQEPHMEVMSPSTKGVQTYLMNRLLVYVYRKFLTTEKRGMLPCIRADELSSQFSNISEPFIRKKLKQFADLQKGSNGQFLWVARHNFRIPSEDELRMMVTPENVCAYESMQAGLCRLKRLGITRLAHLTGPTQFAALSAAMNQLPDEAIALAAASHIERELQITPWNLSSNFVACTSQDRENIERLEITGVGDPSGRGLGFSYVRLAPPKAPTSNAMSKKKAAVGRGSTVTGTDADLRRLSMEAAREVLLKFNFPDEQISKLTRWHRIAEIRKLSSEQAASGVDVDPTTISKYARGQRMSFMQLQQQTREKCQEIWDRQVQTLSAFDGDEMESDSEANSDLDSFAGDLENLLDAEECEEGEDGNLEHKHEKSDGVRGLKMRRHSSQAQLEEEIEDEAAEAAELCSILMSDGGAEWKKKKAKPALRKVGSGLRSNVGFESADRAKKSSTVVKEIIGSALPDGPSSSRQYAIHAPNEGESFLTKKALIGKVKPAKKNDVLLAEGLIKKKVKIMTDGAKVFKEKKSARESFVCGACGQLGHMRTNKNCPKYGEDSDIQLNSADPEKASAKPSSLDLSSQPQQRHLSKKLTPKSVTKISPPEATDGEKSSMKTKVLKVKCASVDKIPVASAQSSEGPGTSEVETGQVSVPKISKIKITSKSKLEDTQLETHKPSVVIRPPTEVGRDQPRQKVIIKRPKEIINFDQLSHEGSCDIEYRKTKKMVELTGLETNMRQEMEGFSEEVARGKTKGSKRLWEEQERRRNMDRQMEERARLYEGERMLENLRRYEEDIRIEREEEERQKAKKMKNKNKKRTEFKDDFLEGYRTKRNNRLMPERDRSAKRKTVVELGRYGAEYVPPTKRRRGGEVGLANILEGIVETMKERYDISYLFLKPVAKKEAPDYLDIVKRPMDLSRIRERVRRLEYKDRLEFRRDVWQITYNAHLYNDGRNPGIPPLADELLKLCDYLLREHDANLTEAEAGCR